MRSAKSIRNSLTMVGGQGFAQLASALTFLILARGLGPDSFGALASIYSMASFASIAVEFGGTNSAIRELTAKPSGNRFARQYKSRVYLTISALTIFLILGVVQSQLIEIATGLALSFALALQRYMTAPLRAALHVGRLAIMVTSEKVALLLAVVLLSFLGQMNGLVFLLASLASSLIWLVAYRTAWGLRYKIQVRNVPNLNFTNPYKGQWHLGVSSAAVGLQSLDSAAIAATAGPAAAGLYAAVGKWTQPLSLVTQAVTQTAYSEMSAARTNSEAISGLRHHAWLLALASLPLVGVIVLADTLTLVLLGPEYQDSAGVLRILAGAVLFGVVNSPLSAFLQSRGDEAFTSKVFVCAMPVQLIMMCVLAQRGGPLLGATAVLAVQGLLALTFFLRSRFVLKTNANGQPKKPSGRRRLQSTKKDVRQRRARLPV